MGYQLGVDLGTTYTAASILRDGRAEMATLGDHAAAVPSVIFLRSDAAILTGDAASRRGLTDPARVARGFKRRLGDPAPLFLGGTPYSADSLMAKMLAWVVRSVSEREGGAPDMVAVCHPANWGPYKKELLGQAIRGAELGTHKTLSEPEAAAIYYASTERVELGSIVAVYDLGGGTFDAAVLRKTAGGFEIMGPPEGIERLGGMDFDEAVFAHVARSVDGALNELDPDDSTAIAVMARLREECTLAKETLSSDTDVSIPVLLPNLQTEVRLTRAEFEAMIRPTLADTIAALERALRSAEVEPTQVDTVLLVGGSSRIPLVGQLVSAELGRPVSVDAHPKHAIAMGAALATVAPGKSKPLVLSPENHDVRSTRAIKGPIVPPPGARPSVPRPAGARPPARVPAAPMPPRPVPSPPPRAPAPPARGGTPRAPSRGTVKLSRPLPGTGAAGDGASAGASKLSGAPLVIGAVTVVLFVVLLLISPPLAVLPLVAGGAALVLTTRSARAGGKSEARSK